MRFIRPFLWALCLALALKGGGQAAFAQSFRATPARPEIKPAPEKPAPDAAKTPADDAPPYEAQLLRLSELLGGLTFLRHLCGASDGAVFRKQMADLLEAEGGEPKRREKYTGAFNFGYRGYETNYRRCTPNAQAIITQALTEVARIARDIPNKYAQ